MARSVLFRSSLAGYNKKDVNDYLAARAKEVEEQIARKNEQITLLSRQLSAAESEAQKAKETLEGELREKADALESCLLEAKAAAEKLLEALSLADEELKKNGEYAEKAKKYDALAGTLSQLLNVEPKEEVYEKSEIPDRSALERQLREGLEKLGEGLNALLPKAQ